MAVELAIRHPDRQEDMTPANDRLVGIVGVEVKPPTDEDPSQDVPRCGDPLPGRPSDAEGKIECFGHSVSPDKKRGDL